MSKDEDLTAVLMSMVAAMFFTKPLTRYLDIKLANDNIVVWLLSWLAFLLLLVRKIGIIISLLLSFIIATIITLIYIML